MTKGEFQGTGTAIVTPFRADGTVDEPALRRLVDFQIAAGIDMLLPCGTTGEGATLNSAETDRVVSVVIDQAAGRVPVIPGAGSNSTATAVAQAKRAEQLGAQGVLSVGPFYNKPTQEGFYQHFKAVAEAVAIPIIVYNVPGRTGSNIEARTMLRLASIPGIRAVKEASGNIAQIMDILRDRPQSLRVLSGDDAIMLPVVALGGDGVISVVSNEAPRQMRELTDAALAGDYERARTLHYQLLPLMNANFMESNPIPVKTALAMMGLIDENFRLPLVPMSEANRDRFRRIVEETGLLKPAGAYA